MSRTRTRRRNAAEWHRREARNRTTRALVVAVLVLPLLAWIAGLALAQTLLVAALAASVAALIRFAPSGDDPGWPDPPEASRDRGARREVARLSWGVTGADQQVSRNTLLRLQERGRHRLARRGLDPDRPADHDAVDALVGTPTRAVLVAGIGDVVRLPEFRRAVQAVESLGTGTDRPATTPSTTRGERR